jgi:putative nucleotidyltransferase with HDIG domain
VGDCSLNATSNWDCINQLLKLHTESELKVVLKRISAAIKQYDPVTYRHSNNVAVYAGWFAKLLKLPEDDQGSIMTAGFLHDVGKLKVPKSIITKESSLDDDEFGWVKKHPVQGGQLLLELGFSEPVVDAVQMHHERYDGSGYPKMLKGEEIPITARILAIVDCFDALSSYRPYRGPLKVDVALKMMSDNVNQFDPKLLSLFKHLLLSSNRSSAII